MPMSMIMRQILLVMMMTGAVACAGNQPSPAPQASQQQPPGAGQSSLDSRTLAIAIRVEPISLATRLLQAESVGLYLPKRMFNAEMASLDDRGNVYPYLLESIPQLNSDAWRVLPDGRMETTYRLKPNLIWHDGQPLTAEDFVFSWRVYSTPALGHANLPPLNAMQEIVAPDPRTVVIRWKQLYPDAAFVGGVNLEFPPLPKHILESALQPDQIETFANHPWWTREFVGAGPYRLQRWEPGTLIEGAAFAGHAMGVPKISRATLKFISDANTGLANLLAGEIQLATEAAIDLPQTANLKREWVPRGLGNVLYHPNQWRAVHFQYRPDLADPPSLLNALARKALASAVDKSSINETLYEGQSVLTDSMVGPTSVWGPAAQRGAIRYPYDVRRSEQLMNEAGFTKGPDGVYVSRALGRLSFEAKTNSAASSNAELSILASTWRQAGFEVEETPVPAAQAQDAQVRATYPAVYVYSFNCCETAILGLTTSTIATAENRWSGNNRGGWSNPDYDRLVDAFSRTLERSERERDVTEMVRIQTDALQAISLFNSPRAYAHVAALRGLREVPPEANPNYNMYEWELQ